MSCKHCKVERANLDSMDALHHDASEILDSIVEAYFDDDNLTPEGETIVAQAAAAHAWFLICIGHLPVEHRMRSMTTGTQLACQVPLIDTIMDSINPNRAKA